MNVRTVGSCITAGLMTVCQVQAQAPAASRAEFEVASVKLSVNDESVPRGISFSPSGRFGWNRMTLKQLIQNAYGTLEFREIVGGPNWIDGERFDIAATSSEALREIAPDGTPRGLFLRLQRLLEERFQLKTHIEMMTRPVFSLETAARPMVTAPGIRRNDVDCDVIFRDMAAGRRPVVPEGAIPPCALRVGPGLLTGHAITMDQMASALSTVAGRPVLNHSTLPQTYDITLKWAPELASSGAVDPAAAAPDLPSLFTAVREQLGLRLDPARAAVPVLVIDTASMPTPD